MVFSFPLLADQFESVRDFIRNRMTETQTPSVSVAVAQDGRILWEEGFGWADRENRVAPNEHTMYPVASITKIFTATALMTLVEQKRVNLDRPVNQYLGNAKIRARVGSADDATVRRVANHTSGLPAHFQFFAPDDSPRLPSMDETILRYGNLVTIPGERFEYSNLGYGILGHVIEHVSQKPYEDYMRQSIFLKLGLSHTSVGIGPGLGKFLATRYATDGLPLPPYDVDHPGGAAILSSAHDLVRFGMFHLKAHLSDQSPVLTDAAIEEMQTPSYTDPGTGNAVGIGWFISKFLHGYRAIMLSGNMPGVSTWLRLIPSEKIAVAVLRNSEGPLADETADEILATLLPKYRTEPAPSRAFSSPAKFEPTPAILGTWTGTLSTYKADLPFLMNVLPSGEVHVQLGQQLKMLLNNVTWEDETLSGTTLGDVGTEDANRRGPYFLRLNLKLRGNLLNGPAYTFSMPGPRLPNGVTQWVELKRN